MNTPERIPTAKLIDQAYAKLSLREQMLIDRMAEQLQEIKNVGPLVAREILAHIGVLLVEEKP